MRFEGKKLDLRKSDLCSEAQRFDNFCSSVPWGMNWSLSVWYLLRKHADTTKSYIQTQTDKWWSTVRLTGWHSVGLPNSSRRRANVTMLCIKKLDVDRFPWYFLCLYSASICRLFFSCSSSFLHESAIWKGYTEKTRISEVRSPEKRYFVPCVLLRWRDEENRRFRELCFFRCRFWMFLPISFEEGLS